MVKTKMEKAKGGKVRSRVEIGKETLEKKNEKKEEGEEGKKK